MWEVTEFRLRAGKERTVSSRADGLETALRSFLNAVADPTIHRVDLMYETDEEGEDEDDEMDREHYDWQEDGYPEEM